MNKFIFRAFYIKWANILFSSILFRCFMALKSERLLISFVTKVSHIYIEECSHLWHKRRFLCPWCLEFMMVSFVVIEVVSSSSSSSSIVFFRSQKTCHWILPHESILRKVSCWNHCWNNRSCFDAIWTCSNYSCWCSLSREVQKYSPCV